MARKKTIYPSKQTMNLAMRERSPFAPSRLVPWLALLLVLALVFGKFAVADRLERVNEAQKELAALEQQRTALLAATADYDQVLETYSRYSVSWMTEEESASVPRTQMLELIESEFVPASQLRQVTASGNTLSVELGGVTLEDTSRFVERLYQRADVANVEVYAASNQEEAGAQAAVSMIVTMVQEGGGQA